MIKKIIIAGGCFWGVEAYFKQLRGVVNTSVGYVNGNISNPTYQDVCEAKATHAEGCEIIYEDNLITLSEILEHMFRFINPVSINKQGGDIGLQYRTGVYYKDENDEIVIKQFIANKQKEYAKKIAVEVEPVKNYYLAEEYHQDYLDKNPNGYCHVDFRLIKDEEKKV